MNVTKSLLVKSQKYFATFLTICILCSAEIDPACVLFGSEGILDFESKLKGREGKNHSILK
jgi:hypothetical protein